VLRDAYPFLVPLAVLALICAVVGWVYLPGFYPAAAMFFLLALFVAFFFRHPHREAPTDERLIVSPADGRVVVVRPLDTEDPGSGTLVSIFLSVFDVHVNRSPLAGKITGIEYRRGKFMIATNHRASVENEQNVVTVENGQVQVVFKQIAGVLARRIVFWKKVGDQVALGESVGLIKFGSRTDLLLPPQVSVTVKPGDRVKGGTSIIGEVGGSRGEAGER